MGSKIEKFYQDKKLRKIFLDHVVGGIGWGIGATIGLSLFLILVSAILNILGGLPVIGDFFAQLVIVTNNALKNRGIQ